MNSGQAISSNGMSTQALKIRTRNDPKHLTEIAIGWLSSSRGKIQGVFVIDRVVLDQGLFVGIDNNVYVCVYGGRRRHLLT